MHYRKPNSDHARRSTGPFNPIYTHFESHFSKLLERRRGRYLEHRYYAPMPDEEKRVRSFVESGTSDTGIVIGPMGIGKTTLLSFLRDSIWEPMGITVITLDMNPVLDRMTLPPNYATLPPADQQAEACAAVGQFLHESLVAFIDREHVELASEQFYDFCNIVNPQLITHRRLRLKGSKLDILRDFAGHQVQSYYKVALKYYLLLTNTRQLVVWVDNTDTHDVHVIDACIDCLTRLCDCAEQLNLLTEDDRQQLKSIFGPSVSTEGPFLVTTLLACRPNTYEDINAQRNVNGLGRRGKKEIRIEDPASIGAILQKRFEHGDFSGLDHHAHVDIGSVRWTNVECKDFISRFINCIGSGDHASRIAALSNDDLSAAMEIVEEIVRNGLFLDYNRVAGIAVAEMYSSPDASSRRVQLGLPWSAIMKCLAYGSQKTPPLASYPYRGSPIANILCCGTSRFGKTTLRAQLVRSLYRLSIQGRGDRIGRLSKRFHRWFPGFTEDDIVEVLQDLYISEIINTPRGLGIRDDRPNTKAFLTKRGQFLWESLAESSVLLECVRDDLDRDARGPYSRELTLALGPANRAEDVVEIASELWRVERREIDLISQSGEYERYSETCGGGTVSRQILRGVMASIPYYRSICPEWPAPDLEAKCKALTRHIAAWQNLWGSEWFAARKQWLEAITSLDGMEADPADQDYMRRSQALRSKWMDQAGRDPMES